jgi:predicted dinucleotide-binding enzyme
VTRVTIVGAGNMGRGIGTRVVAGGHQVEIVDRDPADAQQLAEDLGGSAAALDPGSPFGGEVVVFAVYYPGIKDAVRQYADQLAGKVVVDITNPVDTQTWDRLATPSGTSSAEEVQQLVPEGTPVVKAFNTTFASTLVAAEGRAGLQRGGRAAQLPGQPAGLGRVVIDDLDLVAAGDRAGADAPSHVAGADDGDLHGSSPLALRRPGSCAWTGR